MSDSKTCTRCKLVKPLSEFHVARQGKTKVILAPRCKDCIREHQADWRARNRDRIAETSKRYQQKNRQRIREYKKQYDKTTDAKRREVLRVYGLTVDDYNTLLASQDGCCAICRSRTPGTNRGKHFCVDHCHVTGRVRGLLCYSCNTGLGKFKDNRDVIRNAAEYLDLHTAI